MTFWPRLSGPKAEASFVFCLGLFFTWSNLPTQVPEEIFRSAAIGAGAALSLTLLLEARTGVRSLLRADILMLVSLYGLMFAEFLFPQPAVNSFVSSQAAVAGTGMALLGFAGLTVGRHSVLRSTRAPAAVGSLHLSPRAIGALFLGSLLVGYFHMLLAVSFDPFALIEQMLRPRFSQPWGRGRFGGWADLLNELGLLIYLIPPLAGIVLAQRRQHSSKFVLLVLAGLALTLFYGFSSGTRHVFVIYVITLTVAYLLWAPRMSGPMMSAILIGVTVVLLLSAQYMLEFRRVGLGSYLDEYGLIPTEDTDSLYVDYNLVSLGGLTEVFPDRHEYLGFEIPYHALIRPIPRAIWPSKPEGLSISVEQALGETQRTVAVTFIGEAYMSGGYFAILLVSLLFGAAAAWWNRFGQSVRTNFELALYASGFFAVALSMRSLLWLSVAILPTLALWTYGKWIKASLQSVRP